VFGLAVAGMHCTSHACTAGDLQLGAMQTGSCGTAGILVAFACMHMALCDCALLCA
jgi:hypothetical protein